MHVNECKCKCIYVNVNLCKCNQISLLGYLAIYPEYLKTLITYKTYYCFPSINRCIYMCTLAKKFTKLKMVCLTTYHKNIHQHHHHHHHQDQILPKTRKIEI